LYFLVFPAKNKRAQDKLRGAKTPGALFALFSPKKCKPGNGSYLTNEPQNAVTETPKKQRSPAALIQTQ